MTTIYRSLLPKDHDYTAYDKDFTRTAVGVQGFLERATFKDEKTMFERQFIQLDTRTGRMLVFEDRYTPCIECHEIRFARVLTGLRKISATDRKKELISYIKAKKLS